MNLSLLISLNVFIFFPTQVKNQHYNCHDFLQKWNENTINIIEKKKDKIPEKERDSLTYFNDLTIIQEELIGLRTDFVYTLCRHLDSFKHKPKIYLFEISVPGPVTRLINYVIIKHNKNSCTKYEFEYLNTHWVLQNKVVFKNKEVSKLENHFMNLLECKESTHFLNRFSFTSINLSNYKMEFNLLLDLCLKDYNYFINAIN